MKRKSKSARADGRGGWTPGKRRHADVGDWQQVRIGICSLLDEHYRYGVVTDAALAREVGADARSVRRWLSGEDRPSQERQELCRRWLAERRAEIAST